MEDKVPSIECAEHFIKYAKGRNESTSTPKSGMNFKKRRKDSVGNKTFNEMNRRIDKNYAMPNFKTEYSERLSIKNWINSKGNCCKYAAGGTCCLMKRFSSGLNEVRNIIHVANSTHN